ncbi:hypothetical protein ARMGADRAFT_729846 [Armillaria gallica]|uniref:Uncharacterized protein n=1 Tax=Armillaria gallica TaxID=47427 RepID=A0A2H3CW40_ARMGA|nr:hypothetical protein ARMGADRAFT_729846 [Armillaria gallica]
MADSGRVSRMSIYFVLYTDHAKVAVLASSRVTSYYSPRSQRNLRALFANNLRSRQNTPMMLANNGILSTM